MRYDAFGTEKCSEYGLPIEEDPEILRKLESWK